ncbi:MAG: hypothetical protein SNF68_00700 [Rikenellaceae bacterium]
MKKSYIFQLAALLSLSLVACSEDEGSTVSQTNRFGEQEVGFMPSSTRADITDLESGFQVHATKGTNPTSFMISGDTYLMDSSGDWGWDGTTNYWPETTDEYPVNFYAYYLTSAYSVTADDTATTLEADITVLDAGSQVDILSTQKETDVRPVGGKLSLEFEHIMTCINLDIAATSNSLLYIQSVKFVGADDTNTYDMFTASWGDDTSVADTSTETNYAYLTTSNPAQMVTLDTSAITGSATGITSTYGSFYLMPQTLSPWDLSTTLADARVEIIFRSTAVVEESSATADDDQIGYTNASDHPDYDASTATVSADEHLFVKIAYPLTSSTVSGDDYLWNSGSSYLYNVTLGSVGVTNGYFASTNYYDEDGNETDFSIDNAEIGDEVTPGEIHFTPTLVDWVTESTSSFN